MIANGANGIDIVIKHSHSHLVSFGIILAFWWHSFEDFNWYQLLFSPYKLLFSTNWLLGISWCCFPSFCCARLQWMKTPWHICEPCCMLLALFTLWLNNTQGWNAVSCMLYVLRRKFCLVLGRYAGDWTSFKESLLAVCYSDRSQSFIISVACQQLYLLISYFLKPIIDRNNEWRLRRAVKARAVPSFAHP